MAESVRAKLVVSRRWHNPAISVEVHREQRDQPAKLAITMPIDDFLQILAAELTADKHTLKSMSFIDRLKLAANRVVDDMKENSGQGLA